MPLKGYKITEEHRKNLSESHKGYKMPSKQKDKIGLSHLGSKRTEEAKKKMSLIRKDHLKKGLIKMPSDENHYLWKGDKVSYYGLHIWVRRNLGSPNTCEKCGFKSNNKRKIQWANKSRNYNRILSDWIRLCVKCHHIYDKDFRKGGKFSKSQKQK